MSTVLEQPRLEESTPITQLQVSSKDLETYFKSIGADVIHPAQVKIDPIAVKDGKLLGVWIE